MNHKDIETDGFEDYQLLDCGDGRKLEKFGRYILDRPDPQSLWSKSKPDIWKSADAIFNWSDKGERWKIIKEIPDSWNIHFQGLVFSLSLKQLKHVGIFPEHASQWTELQTLCESNKGIKVLNLFGYTGVVSIISAKSGAQVTHVDASKIAINIVRENLGLSGLSKDSIRLVCEDAIKYVKRLIKREERFDVIIMDPPAFGRGPKGEIWKIEDSIKELVELIPKILSDQPKMIILNGYSSGYSSRTFGELLNSVLLPVGGQIYYGDIGIKVKDSPKVLTTGIYAKWQA